LEFGDEFLGRISAVRERISATPEALDDLRESVGALRAAREQALGQLHSVIFAALSQMRRVREARNGEHDLSQLAHKAITGFEVLYGEVKGQCHVA
jgi:hypothetical protein